MLTGIKHEMSLNVEGTMDEITEKHHHPTTPRSLVNGCIRLGFPGTANKLGMSDTHCARHKYLYFRKIIKHLKYNYIWLKLVNEALFFYFYFGGGRGMGGSRLGKLQRLCQLVPLTWHKYRLEQNVALARIHT